MGNARLDEVQAEIKIAGRNIYNLPACSMQMTLRNSRKRRGTKKPLDEGKREEWKSWLKTQHSKN